MNVTLSAELAKRVKEIVQRGEYASTDAMVEHAVYSFLDTEDDAIRRRLQTSEAEIERGEFPEL